MYVTQDRNTWEGTAADLLTTLDGARDDLPVDATKISKALTKLASQLEGAWITLERLTQGTAALRLWGLESQDAIKAYKAVVREVGVYPQSH